MGRTQGRRARAGRISCQSDDDAAAEPRFHGLDGTSGIRYFAQPRRERHHGGRSDPHRWFGGGRDTRARQSGNPSRRRYRTPHLGSGRRMARRRVRWRRAPGRANGSLPLIGVIRSSCWRSRLPHGCRSWCRSATGGCWCRRSRSSAARPTRWRPIWPASPGPALTCSCVAMRICPTSVLSPGPIGGWCSASTTSTRRCRARSSGT